ncbi:leukocyte elastase inhibitor-like [Strongylocentrotus purpuratus]|uniref:Serpin domain-containing protein n=1 Tax=Strongylocentrotus purpuratus TaxID=7668 RepID=A0A7M7PAB6_STRPU|nr:leukocyte elastase inhibitor-like [Strongylocentrotus purpuratus]
MAFSKQQDTSGQLVQLSSANIGFALDLYQTLQDERRGKNMFFSPLSISTALAMTQLGARGDTATQIADVFRFNQIDPDQLHGTFKELKNLLYQTNYDSQIHSIEAVNNFASPIATQSINDWVSKQTEGKIKNLIAPGILNDLTSLVLVNAIYFKANWKSTFRAYNTTQDTFKVFDERKNVPASLMSQEERFYLAVDKTNDCLVLEMPYQGNNLSLLIALPTKDDGLGQLETKLSVDVLQSWDAGLEWREVDVLLPKFKVEATFQLKEVLQRMGMPDAFDEDRANFKGISSEEKEFYISAVIHKAFVDINEEGSEAAAATAVDWGRGCARPSEREKPILFRADHTFLFMIRHRSTKSVLFMGRMMDPSYRQSGHGAWNRETHPMRTTVAPDSTYLKTPYKRLWHFSASTPPRDPAV